MTRLAADQGPRESCGAAQGRAGTCAEFHQSAIPFAAGSSHLLTNAHPSESLLGQRKARTLEQRRVADPSLAGSAGTGFRTAHRIGRTGPHSARQQPTSARTHPAARRHSTTRPEALLTPGPTLTIKPPEPKQPTSAACGSLRNRTVSKVTQPGRGDSVTTEKISHLHFKHGLPGFPDSKDFTLSPWGEGGTPFSVMASLDEAHVRFVVVPPDVFFPGYVIDIDDNDARTIDLQSADDALLVVILTLKDKPENATANLLGPIVINTRNYQAMQVAVPGHSPQTPLKN